MRNSVEQAADMLVACFRNGSKLLLCGNGGSAADSAHISGELCKGFLRKRPPGRAFVDSVGESWAASLHQGLPAIDLGANGILMTAVINDISGEDIFSQQVMAYGRAGDVLLGLSTSGNAENVRRALMVAKAKGMHTIAMTGAGGGRLAAISTLLLDVEETETYLVQEQHIRLYHQLCIMIEDRMFG